MKPLLLSFLFSITLWADAHIFVYHRFDDDRYPTTNTTIEELKKEFEYFKNNGYEVVPLEKLTIALKHKKDIPDNWVVLTIDDAYKSFYTNGLRVFKEYNYPFSLFIPIEAIEKRYPDYMSWQELRETSKYGSLEYHSYGHKHMTYLSDDEIREDFKKGLTLFKKKLKIKPKVFSYPYGEYSPRVQKIAKSYGFDAIVNQNMGAVSNFSDIYDLDRTALVGKSNLKLYLRYKALKARWKEPTIFPSNETLTLLHVETDERAKRGGVYITGYGWQEVRLKNGNFDMSLNKKLVNKRSRIIISVGDKISTKLLIKDKYGTR